MLERAAPWVGQATPHSKRSAAHGTGRTGQARSRSSIWPMPIRPTIPVGVESAAGGRAAVEAVFRACDLTMAGETDAVVTAPLEQGRDAHGRLQIPRPHRAAGGADRRRQGHDAADRRRTCVSSTSRCTSGWPRRSRGSRRSGCSTRFDLADEACRGARGRAAADRRRRAQPARQRGRPVRRSRRSGQIVPAIAAARAEGLDVSRSAAA